MSDHQTRGFESLFKQFSQALPPGPQALHADLEKNLRAALNSALNRMNLVTREEFDVQAAVLARTRSKLEALERRVAALETGQPQAPPAAPAPVVNPEAEQE